MNNERQASVNFDSHTQTVKWYMHLEGESQLLVPGRDEIKYEKDPTMPAHIKVTFGGMLGQKMIGSDTTGRTNIQFLRRDGNKLFLRDDPDTRFTCVIEYFPGADALHGVFKLPKAGDGQSGGWG
jgi:hypothetical protein